MKKTQSLFLILLASLLLSIGLSRPYHNWDMIGYVASAYHKDGYRDLDLLNRTYTDVRAEVTKETFGDLTSGHYRNVVFTDHKSLTQQIPFYSIRVAYVELIRLSSIFDVSYSKATYLISSIFSALSVLILGRFFALTGVQIILLPIVLLVAGFLDIARLSTPDAMACFFSLLGIYCLARNSYFALIIAALFPLIRTDFVLLSIMMCGYEFYRGKRIFSLLSLAAAMMIYSAINHYSGNYGWLTIFNFTLISIDPYPANITPSGNIKDYVQPYSQLLRHIISHQHFIVYVIAAYVVYKQMRQSDFQSQAIVMTLIPLLFVIFHLVLFPVYMERFFVFSVALALTWVLQAASGNPSKRHQNESQW